jgi:outer membrane protein OmpA-like peptidoglycan-associated protein
MLYATAGMTAQSICEENFNSGILYAATIITTAQDGDDDNILESQNIRIINLGPAINHDELDYAPTISADGKTLFYVSNREGSIYNDDEGMLTHDFWYGRKKDRYDTTFYEIKNLDPSNRYGEKGVNTEFNEGAATIASDRQTIYFTACNRADGLGSCDIYTTQIEGTVWQQPINLGPNVNGDSFDAQPSISADGSTLYFVSTREGPNSDGELVKDNFDIWYSEYDWDLEEWGKAKNLEKINTENVEESPFIAADNTTLFFSSDGHEPRVGGQDFFITRYDGIGNWSTPENLGEPINTELNEQFISLPASGDIIYFSSTREDIDGNQGSLDVYMAFVPSYFQAVQLAGSVKDECSGEFIPSVVTVTNPITNDEKTFTLTQDKQNFEFIVTNDEYGDPTLKTKFIDYKIVAENEKYGTRELIQRVMKPEKTKDQNAAGQTAEEYFVELTLGQRPVLTPSIDEADYIMETKAKQPELNDWRGLVMLEKQVWNLYPLLTYVFFPEGESEIPNRYIMFESADDEYKQYFSDTTVKGGTMDKYYHVLNILGFRLNQHPDTKITITGTNDNVTEIEKGNKELSEKRMLNVKQYLNDIWGIDDSRITTEVRNFPATKSNPRDSLGIQENRRVEIYSDSWEIMKPVFENDPRTFPQPETMTWNLDNGIEDALVASRRIEITKGDKQWRTIDIADNDIMSSRWNWMNENGEYPENEEQFEAQFIVTTNGGAECISDPVMIPVKQVTQKEQLLTKGSDTIYENYSLILFKFNSFDAGPLNERIMKDYVYERVKPNTTVEVIGHTDVVGMYEVNKRLSVNRAKTVFTGIKLKTSGKYADLTTEGVGEDDPLYTNELPEGRFYNRTVQVLLKTPISAEQGGR